MRTVFFAGSSLCPLNRDNEYNDYVNIFLGPNSLFPERRCPLNGGVPKERFHCNLIQKGDSRFKPRCQTNTQGLEITEKCRLCHEVCEQLGFLIFADKEENP